MFIFLDTETTGTGPDDRLCQIAFKPEVGPATSELFNPGMPISIDAMAVHHITNKMVEDICNYAKLGMISMYLKFFGHLLTAILNDCLVLKFT